MLKKVRELRVRKKAVEEHEGVRNLKKQRLVVDRSIAEKTPIALKFKKEYREGCMWIKNILEFKSKNKLLYFTGRQAGEIFKKHPSLDSPNAVRSILIASVNPNLTIQKIDSIVTELFSNKLAQKERREVIITMIRSIKIENYEYLL